MISERKIQDILSYRRAGVSDREIAARFGLTKGQVSGIIFRRTSDLYKSRLGGNPEQVLRNAYRRLALSKGAAAARAVVRELAAQ